MRDGLRERLLDSIGHDLPAALVVFLVALPLCLGIALASGAPLFSGLVAGVVGGVVAGTLSKSPVSVSGPAAGLSTVVLSSIQGLGSFDVFLVCVVWAGVIQLILGYLNVGTIGYFIPYSVIKGMLSAIGLILILKQLPHAAGYDRDFEGDESFFQRDGQNTFSEVFEAFQYFSLVAVLIALVSLFIMVYWDSIRMRISVLKFVPAPLVVVLVAVLINVSLRYWLPGSELGNQHLVNLPGFDGGSGFSSLFTFPDWQHLFDSQVLGIGLTIALIASLESLLSVEASDRMDPYRRSTPLNDELKAQGATNLISGILGGLPVTAVIVRSAANVQAGARTKVSTITHGVLLALSVLAFPQVLKEIPLACLAGILLVLGYKLLAPGQFKSMFQKGPEHYLPFVVTVAGILLSDILVGIGIGLSVAIFFVLKSNYRTAIILVNNDDLYMLKFTKDVSFVHKSSLRLALLKVPVGASLIIDETRSHIIDPDIRETIDEYIVEAPLRSIKVELKRNNTINGHALQH